MNEPADAIFETLKRHAALFENGDTYGDTIRDLCETVAAWAEKRGPGGLGIAVALRASAERVPTSATHRCKVCRALWRLNGPDLSQPKGSPLRRDGSWTCVTPQPWKTFPGHLGGQPSPCGPCCDNVAMGDQIEALPL
jgi:hypothetical protein